MGQVIGDQSVSLAQPRLGPPPEATNALQPLTERPKDRRRGQAIRHRPAAEGGADPGSSPPSGPLGARRSVPRWVPRRFVDFRRS
jgi:hypothetical protein